jgi:hypothetical protein
MGEGHGGRGFWGHRIPPIPLSAKALCPNAPEKWCSSGTGPERALDRSNLCLQRVSAIAPSPERSLRVQDLSRGPTPTRLTPPRFPIPKQPVPKQTHPIPLSAKALCPTPQKNSAAAGQGRNEHWIVATNPPKRVSAIAPPLVRSLRVQDRSRGPTPTSRT